LIPGAIHLSMSTISTTASSELASEHARDGQGYVAAPVFGNPDAAKARQLFVIAAGAPTMSNDEPISTVARIRCGAFTRKAGPMTTI
jgi:3-hydroxyisobutyrate dehydrogenase-like beta-hydroxyacid dehydrogenase